MLLSMIPIVALADLPPEEEGICVRVRIRINQEVAMTRSAFRATLQVSNAPEGQLLENLAISLNITNLEQQTVTDLFGIDGPQVTGTSDVSGTGTIVPGESATAVWTIIPTRDAAPVTPTRYWVGGTLSYTEGETNVEIPLYPAHIWVKPDPLLRLHYFLVREVFSDDPRTPDIIEPTEPFPLGLVMVNDGRGSAHKVRITSSQPEIIENEKGLLIDFTIIGTQINTDQVSPSLTVNLGDIDPGQTAVARWLMTCSLQGDFIEYEATFEHVDDLGDPRLSLIDSVDIHQLTHVVQVDIPVDDLRPDFLVNDVEDDDFLPDTLYKSDGSTEVVNAPLNNPQVDGEITAEIREATLTAQVDNGWTYIRATDPGEERFRLSRVVRSDGREIMVDENAWTTHRTRCYEPTGCFREHHVHIFDHDSTGVYTLFYEGGDGDGDEVADHIDNCPNTANPQQENTDQENAVMPGYPAGDELGDACDPDDDNDGLSDVTEGTLGTNPKDPDTDGDQLPDGLEAQAGCCTLPGAEDTDSDGLWDGTEDANQNGLLDPEETDPCVSDSDGDGMLDGFESDTGLNPLIDDAFGDADGDGFCNLREYVGGSNPGNDGDRPSIGIIYVDDDNISEVEDGGLDHPFDRISEGIGFAGPYDTVYVFAGSYTENLTVTKPIRLEGAEKALPLIDGSGDDSPAVQFTNVPEGTISGFRIVGGTGAGIASYGSTLLVKGNLVSGTIGGDGVWADGLSTVTLFNNLIYGNANDGIRSSGMIEVVNNTVSANDGDGIDCTNGSIVTVKNNILFENAGFGITAGSVPAPEIVFNNLYGNDGGNLAPGLMAVTGNMQVNPFFVDSLNHDYHLAEGSPCIDSGMGDRAPEVDFDGHCRYDQPDVINTGGGHLTCYDMGAFEYVDAPADLDGDADVDEADLALFASDFGIAYCPGCVADLDGDGDVDGFDFTRFVQDQARFLCPGEACQGDMDRDFDVDASDLSILTSDYHRTDCDEGAPCEGDLDKDLDVDWFDLADFVLDFGRTDCPVCPR